MAGMYPEERTLTIDGESVSFPGLKDGKFTLGNPEDPDDKPSFIAPETINLLLDNLTSLVEFFGIQANNTSITQVKEAVVAGIDSTTFAGKIEMSATETVPAGWLLCDGSAVSRTTYARLFVAIGSKWGSGDGSKTFNLPDLIGASPVGAGTSKGYTVNETFTFAQKYNDSIKTHQHSASSGTESADHTHSGSTSSVSHNHLGGERRVFDGADGHFGTLSNVGYSDPTQARQTGNNLYDLDYTDTNTHSHSFSTSGRSASHTHAITISGSGDGPTTHGKLVGLNFLIKT